MLKVKSKQTMQSNTIENILKKRRLVLHVKDTISFS